VVYRTKNAMLQKSDVLAQLREVMMRKEVVTRPEGSTASSLLEEEKEKENEEIRHAPITALRTAGTAMRR